MSVTLDTNVLIYALDDGHPARRDSARRIVDAAIAATLPLGLQVCGEFYRVVTRKLRMPDGLARRHARVFLNSMRLFSASRETMEAALDLASTGRLSFWDANLVSAAEAAGCTHLLSEDMHDGLRAGRLEIVNPFAGDDLSPRARTLLDL